MLANIPPILAVVLPCYNEEESISYAFEELSSLLSNMVHQKEISENSYLYFVDDGSTDATWQILSNLHRSNKTIKGMKLSRNFGHQIALLAGLSQVSQSCDITISIDADLQQDPGLSHLRGHFICSRTKHLNTDSIIFKISKTIRSSLYQLHLSMKPFCYSI